VTGDSYAFSECRFPGDRFAVPGAGAAVPLPSLIRLTNA
jgi:hypothetical protein